MQGKPQNSIISRLYPLQKALLSNQHAERTLLFQEFDNSGNVSGINNIKWEEIPLNKGKKDIYPLWIADMDFPSPVFIQKALQKRVAYPNYGYTFTSDDYYNAIIQWYHQNHGFLLHKSDIFRFSAKSLTGLAMLIQALTEKGDGILMLTPIYHAFFHVIASNERKTVECPLVYKDRSFFIDFEDLERKILLQKPKILLFCNPHNPIARVWKKSEIERAQEVCLRYDVLFVSDEVFSDLVFEGHIHVAAAFEPYIQNTVLLYSLGKSFNLNGVETGFMVSKNKKIIEKINTFAGKFSLIPEYGNIFSQIVTTAAFSAEGKQWLEYVKEYIYGNYRMMVDYLEHNLKEMVPVVLEGGYILLCDYEGLGVSEEEFIKKSEEENIFVVAGSKLHANGKFFRINIACSKKVLKGALEKWRVMFTNENSIGQNK